MGAKKEQIHYLYPWTPFGWIITSAAAKVLKMSFWSKTILITKFD